MGRGNKKLSKMCQKGELNYKKGWANKKISAPERRAIKNLLIWERNTRSPSHSKSLLTSGSKVCSQRREAMCQKCLKKRSISN